MIVSVLAALAVFALPVPSSGDTGIPLKVGQAEPAPKPQCTFAIQKIREHRSRTWALQRTLGARPPIRVSTSRIVGCRYARWVEGLWWRRSVEWGKRAKYRVLPDVKDWGVAIAIAQRVYPGTSSWLWSCSGAEGGHSYWKWYAGRHWTGGHIGNDFLGMDTVGGWMQFRFSTFRIYQDDALATARAHGFVVPRFVTPLGGPARYAVWLSPLGQALTAGYMRYFHKDASHWSASWGNGC